jgi:serine-type D-Ala-D-Ala carboxypeptidase/endopeptidase
MCEADDRFRVRGGGACVDTQATDGSGGLYSTGNDMARWPRHNLADSNGVLALSQAACRPRQSMPAAISFDKASPMAALRLGWVTVAAQGIQPMLVVKNGGGAGFMSYIAFAPGLDEPGCGRIRCSKPRRFSYVLHPR